MIAGEAGKTSANTLSVDRVIPTEGYTDENTVALCFRCNTLKRDKSAEELFRMCESGQPFASERRRIAEWLAEATMVHA